MPVNALVIDPLNATHFYIGTDIGVFRTTDSGSTWQLFSDGLPNTAVYDLRLHANTRLLRAATHGRGLWERLLDVNSMPDVDLYVRDNLMSTGRIVPTPPLIAAFDDPLQYVSLGDPLFWWQCADAKVDSPAPTTHNYQYPVAQVDYLVYETLLQHSDTQVGATNRVYVQIHNRGIKTADNVTVKVLYANASPSLPPLPHNFWTAFPGNGDQTDWKTIVSPPGPFMDHQVIPHLSPRHPEILEWDWNPPQSAGSHSCLLIVVDCPSDPIPQATRMIFDIGTLVTREKRVGLKNLHVIGGLPTPYWSALTIYGSPDGRDMLRLQGLPTGWSVGVLFPEKIADKLQPKSIKRSTATKKKITNNLELKGLKRTTASKKQITALQEFLRREVKVSEFKHFYALADPKGGAEITNIPRVKDGFPLLLVVQAGDRAKAGSFNLIQTAGQTVIGGNTFALRPRRK